MAKFQNLLWRDSLKVFVSHLDLLLEHIPGGQFLKKHFFIFGEGLFLALNLIYKDPNFFEESI